MNSGQSTMSTTRHAVGHETLDYELYIDIKAYKSTIFEILRFFCIVIAILCVCAIPT